MTDPLPPAIKRGIIAGEYRIRANEDAFLAVNRAADLRARWSPSDGLSAWRLRGDDSAAKRSEISLKAMSVGRAGPGRGLRSGELALGACRSDGTKDEYGDCLKRLERDLDGVTEWWENREDGIAHGFAVERAPSGTGSWLRVAIRVAGARIELDPDARGAVLIGNDQRFSYRGLAAWDAERRSLPTRMRRAGTHLLLEVDDRGARYPVVIDPVLTLNAWAYESNQATPPPDSPAGLDMVVAGARDVNGDTHQDVLVAFPRYNSVAGNNSGIVYLFLGGPGGPSLIPSWSSEGTNVANTAAGPTAGALFGRAIAAGNINGDAFADVVVGQVGWGNGESLEGRVYVFFGQAGASPLPAVANQVLEGRSTNAFFGRAVALGNLDGANGDDLVVGSSGFNAGAGRVEVYLADAAGAFPVDASPSDTVVGAAGSSLGESVAAGDTNADGRADVHAAARTHSGPAGFEEGALYSSVTDSGGRLGMPFIFTSGIAGGQLGRVAFAGDVNGDGFGDVVAGAPRPDGSGFDSSVFVLYGSSTGITSAGLSRIVDSCTMGFCPSLGSSLFGAAVAGPADVDSDGFFDVIAGAPGWSPPNGQGAVFVIRGSAGGPVVNNPHLIDTDSRFFGEAAGDALGSTLAVAGDVNKDGFTDILAGAGGFEDGAEVDEGKAFLFLGGAATAKMAGQACALNAECLSGFCVDGVCCNTICGGIPGVEADNTSDCQACSMAASGAPNGVCRAARIATPCTSTNLCLDSSVCDESGSCIGGVPKVCPITSNPCVESGVCDPTTGACNPNRPDGLVCDDGNACTAATACLAGVCSGPVTVICAPPAVCKLAGTCNTSTGVCDYPNAADGIACADTNLCTTGETCLAGTCRTTPELTCGAETICRNAGSCDPATGVCSQTNRPDGTTCDDGNACTVDNVCVAGACSVGTARNCDDGDPCTMDSCAPASGCANVRFCAPDAGVDAAPEPVDAAPEPIDTAPGPVDAAPDPIDTAPDPIDTAPDPTDVTTSSPDTQSADVQPTDSRDAVSPDGPIVLDARPADAATDARLDARPVDRPSDARPSDGASDRPLDASVTDAPRDFANRDSARDTRAVRVGGGGGCDCEVSGSKPDGTVFLSLLIGLVLVVIRTRSGRASAKPDQARSHMRADSSVT
jgi:hypothetical protein